MLLLQDPSIRRAHISGSQVGNMRSACCPRPLREKHSHQMAFLTTPNCRDIFSQNCFSFRGEAATAFIPSLLFCLLLLHLQRRKSCLKGKHSKCGVSWMERRKVEMKIKFVRSKICWNIHWQLYIQLGKFPHKQAHFFGVESDSLLLGFPKTPSSAHVPICPPSQFSLHVQQISLQAASASFSWLHCFDTVIYSAFGVFSPKMRRRWSFIVVHIHSPQAPNLLPPRCTTDPCTVIDSNASAASGCLIFRSSRQSSHFFFVVPLKSQWQKYMCLTPALIFFVSVKASAC